MKKRLSVLIPYRNREENLSVFIPYFRNFMKNNFSDIEYEIVVVEQGNDKLFNKGILFNIGYLLTSGNTDYYVLHDVDQLPITADYSYNDEPCHLCVNALEQGTDGVLKNPYVAEKYQHKGGAITVSREHYEMANGHSNMYWGWGLIDDDFSFRLFDIGHHLQRYGTRMNHGGLENNDKGYYVTLCAKTDRFHSDENYKRNYNYAVGVVRRETNWRLEGLNTTKFNIIDVVKCNGYTKYKVDFENDVNT
jgi:glycosyltransferase involved in cell wall biosynthesis